MRCPYQTKVIHQPEYKEGYTTHFATDITVFCECFGEECPFYYTTREHKTVAHCRKAESEHKRTIDADELLKRIAEKCKTLSLSKDTINGLCGATAIIYDMLFESGQEDVE